MTLPWMVERIQLRAIASLRQHAGLRLHQPAADRRGWRADRGAWPIGGGGSARPLRARIRIWVAVCSLSQDPLQDVGGTATNASKRMGWRN